MVVVEDREFLRIWGYLSQKCRKTWALVPSNKFRLLSYTIPELSLRRFQSFIYVHPTFAWISLRTSKNPLQGLSMGSALNVLFPSVFARMSPSQWEGLWSSCLYPLYRYFLAYFSSALTSLFIILSVSLTKLSTLRAWSFVSFFH